MEKIVFSIIIVGRMEPYANREMSTCVYALSKVNLNCGIINLNIKLKIITVLKKHRRNLSDLKLGENFLWQNTNC